MKTQLQKQIQEGDTRFVRAGSKFNGLLGTDSALPGDYHPKLDVSPELSPMDAAYHQSLIGILRWIVEMGRVNICLETSVMSSCLVLSREDHLSKLFQMFGYLKSHINTELVFDSHLPLWWNKREAMFPQEDWRGTTYFNGTEESLKDSIPEDTPAPLGQGVTMSAWVDSDYASDKVTHCLRTDFLVYIQSSLIYWLTKKQGSVETSSFRSGFVAMKHCTEYVRGFCFKLRMMECYVRIVVTFTSSEIISQCFEIPVIQKVNCKRNQIQLPILLSKKAPYVMSGSAHI